MSRTLSPSSNKPYGVACVVSVWNLARSSFYAARHRQQHPQEARKRGPKLLSDEALLIQIRQLLAAPVFPGEGYRKICARLRFAGVRTSKERVLRLLREISCSRRCERRKQPGAIHMTAPSLRRRRIRCGARMPLRRSPKRMAQ